MYHQLGGLKMVNAEIGEAKRELRTLLQRPESGVHDLVTGAGFGSSILGPKDLKGTSGELDSGQAGLKGVQPGYAFQIYLRGAPKEGTELPTTYKGVEIVYRVSGTISGLGQ